MGDQGYWIDYGGSPMTTTGLGKRPVSGWACAAPAVMGWFLVVGAVGCGHQGQVQSAAAADFRCPEDEVSVEPLEADDVYVAEGCDERELYGCGSGDCESFANTVHARAVKHFGCPADRVHVEQRDWRGVYVARGCQLEAVYLCGAAGCFRRGSPQ